MIVRKVNLALIAFVCLLCSIASCKASEVFGLLVSDSGAVSVKSDSATDCEVNAGTWVQILDTVENISHIHIGDGLDGFISTDKVKRGEIRHAMMGFVSNPGKRSFLNLRSGPSYTADVLNVYYNGVPCVLLSEQDGWMHVRINGVDGYFRKEYVRVFSAPYGESVATVSTPSGTGLNLRSGPGYEYRAVGQLDSGTYLTLLQKGNDWWMVSDGSRTGFIRADFATEGIIQPDFYPSDSAGGTYALVTNPKSTQVLNLRARPGKAYESIGQYSNGARVTILYQGLEWCKVEAKDGKTGYMMTDYLTLYNAMDTPTMSVVQEDRTFVNLREEPSLTGKVLCEIPHGSKVVILSPDESWFRVRYDSFTGYIAASFLQ